MSDCVTMIMRKQEEVLVVSGQEQYRRSYSYHVLLLSVFHSE